MKVKELIKELEKYDPEMEVITESYQAAENRFFLYETINTRTSKVLRNNDQYSDGHFKRSDYGKEAVII